jgi:hypothetical protein
MRASSVTRSSLDKGWISEIVRPALTCLVTTKWAEAQAAKGEERWSEPVHQMSTARVYEVIKLVKPDNTASDMNPWLYLRVDAHKNHYGYNGVTDCVKLPKEARHHAEFAT